LRILSHHGSFLLTFTNVKHTRTQEFYCFKDFEHLPAKLYDYKKVCLVYPKDYGYSGSPTYDYDSKVGSVLVRAATRRYLLNSL